MNFVRNILGYSTEAAPSSAHVSTVQQRDVDANKLARAQDIQLHKLETRAARLAQQKQDAVKARNPALIKQTIQLQRKNDTELNQLRGLIANRAGVQDAIGTAATQRDTALVLKAGADELETTVKEMETIDTDGIADRLQDASAESQAYGSRLSEPIFNSGIDADEIDDEVAALMEAGEVQLPDAPVAAPAPVPVPVRTRVPVKRGTRKAV